MDQYQAIGTVVVALIALFSFIKPIMDLKSVLVELRITLTNLQKVVCDTDSLNKKEHDLIFQQLRDHGDRLLRIEMEHEHNHWEE